MNTQTVDAAAETLARLLSDENACLERVDYVGAIALAPAKRSAIEALVAAQDATGTAARGPRGTEELARRLDRLADENRQLLARALAVQSRVIDCFARAVPTGQPGPRYGARGTMAQTRAATPVALLARA